MKKRMANLVLLGMLTIAGLAFADTTLFAPCAACHGKLAQGQPLLFAPRLAGQNAGYLVEQLKNFRAGSRGASANDMPGQMMAVSAKNLSDGNIERLASFLAKLPGENIIIKSGDVARGKRIYAETCLACHGVDGKGVNPLYTPNLRILSAAYLERQLKAYRDGWRGNGEQGTTRSKSMRAIVTQLKGENDIEDLLAFLSH